ncbi:uncharacterized protein LOC113318567 isoform X1 [Papaver somniferum]|uniref:uncharacterized protein LOC113318567 isoform X1 n=1 Tax=Papaver somniferum TaxID=3469 RepID=UPI000E6FBF8D|nr:uncharacterized protein LOC113318567 isoform X1 [Papaver somniferum]
MDVRFFWHTTRFKLRHEGSIEFRNLVLCDMLHKFVFSSQGTKTPLTRCLQICLQAWRAWCCGGRLSTCGYSDFSCSRPNIVNGFSISIVKADESILKQLDAPTRAPSWPIGADGKIRGSSCDYMFLSAVPYQGYVLC